MTSGLGRSLYGWALGKRARVERKGMRARFCYGGEGGSRQQQRHSGLFRDRLPLALRRSECKHAAVNPVGFRTRHPLTLRCTMEAEAEAGFSGLRLRRSFRADRTLRRPLASGPLVSNTKREAYPSSLSFYSLSLPLSPSSPLSADGPRPATLTALLTRRATLGRRPVIPSWRPGYLESGSLPMSGPLIGEPKTSLRAGRDARNAWDRVDL